VDESCDESLSSLADAVEEVLEPPYRAVAVRQGMREWTVSARAIEVRRLRLTSGDSPRLICGDAANRLEVDGSELIDPDAIAELEELGSDISGDYEVEGTRLDGDLW